MRNPSALFTFELIGSTPHSTSSLSSRRAFLLQSAAWYIIMSDSSLFLATEQPKTLNSLLPQENVSTVV